MNKKKTLIAYETKSGVTEESANIIAEVLYEKYRFSVDVLNLKEQPKPELRQYDNIFIGTGIRMGRWYRKANYLLKSDFEGRNLVIFLSAC